MGYYLETPVHIFKANQLVSGAGATKIAPPLKWEPWLVCVVINPAFDAAMFVYDEREFRRVTDPRDHRPKQWLKVPEEYIKRELPFLFNKSCGCQSGCSCDSGFDNGSK